VTPILGLKHLIGKGPLSQKRATFGGTEVKRVRGGKKKTPDANQQKKIHAPTKSAGRQFRLTGQQRSERPTSYAMAKGHWAR